MLDTMVISGEDVCCSVVFGTLGFSVMWSELLMMLLLVVLCGHQYTSDIKWSVHLHLRGGLSVVCL